MRKSDHMVRCVALAVLVLVSACSVLSVSAQSRTITRTAVWPAPEGQPKVGDVLELEWPKPFDFGQVPGMLATIELRFDPRDIRSERAMDLELELEVTATVNKDLSRYDKRADKDSIFILRFVVGKRSQGAAMAARVYPDSLLDRALDNQARQLHHFRNAHHLRIRLAALRANTGRGMVPLQVLPRGVDLDARLEGGVAKSLESPNTPPVINEPVPIDCSRNTSGKDELVLSWMGVGGADAYHLEWTWTDDYEENGGQLLPADVFYDLQRNATRVSVDGSQTYYSLPLLFDRGWIVWRVRAIGVAPGGLPEYGAWSWNIPTGPVGSVPGNARFAVSAHQQKANWQLTTSYAEEGKRKEVMTYADGTLRSRQAVTRNNSLYVPIIGETFYDAPGRPAVEAMPVPLVREQGCPELMGSQSWAPIDLYPRFNQADDDADLDPVDTPTDFQYFHMYPSGSVCEPGGVPFHAQNGAELYYHPEHLNTPDALTGKPGFLPQAEGFPYTQTQFTRDNTGRIRAQSGVGSTFRLGTDHETRYFYGTPEQIKLDRLFGAEAGYSTHYQKNISIDPNGQASVTYLDRAGRTIATALTGGAPEQLGPLASQIAAPMLETDLFNGQTSLECEANTLRPEIPALVFTNQIVVPADGLNYVLKYTLSPVVISDPCLEVCLNCVYELTFSVVDQCGVQLVTDNGAAVIGTFQASEDGPLVFAACGEVPADYVHPDLTLELDAGEYTITKILRLSTEARDAYIQEILTNPGDYFAPGCFTSEEELIAGYTSAVDVSDCEVTCQACVDALGDLDDFLLAGGEAQAYWQLYDECQAPCRADSWCDVAYEAMLVDVSLGGQYAGYSVDANGELVSDDRASVFYFNSAADHSALLTRGVQWTGSGYAYAPGNFANVQTDRPIWRQPRYLDGNSLVPEYRTTSGERFRVVVEWINNEWSPAIEPGTQVLFDNIQAYNYVYPENLATLELFISYWQPGFERSLLFYHPEYCYWLSCKEYDEVKAPQDTWTSDEFDEYLITVGYQEAITNQLVDINAPQEQRIRVQFAAPVGGLVAPLAGKYDPFAVHASQYAGPHATSFVASISAYKQWPAGGPMLSMAEFAAAMIMCGGQTSAPYDLAWGNFLATGNDEQKEQQWETFKRLYFSEKYRAQKRMADADAYGCTHCSGVNFCIGQGEDEDEVWRGRMNAPAMTIEPWYFPSQNGWGIFTSWYENLYEAHTNMLTQLHGRPIVQGCQVCNETNHELFVDKVPRVPDPELFPGMNMSPGEMAFQNYMATGDCPVATGWMSLLNGLILEDDLVSTGLSLDGVPGWTSLYSAQFGSGSPAPSTTWSAQTGPAHVLSGSFNGCPFTLTAPPDVLSLYADFWTGIFTASGIEATSPTTYNLFVQYMPSGGGAPVPVTLTGTICSAYDLITCNFPQVGTGNALAEDIEDLLTVLAQADPQLLLSPGVDLSQATMWPQLSPGGGAPPVPAGPVVQAQVPSHFTTGDWTDALQWSFDGVSGFTIASGTDNCPRYGITVINITSPGGTFTINDLTQAREFRNMVSAGSNLFDVEVYSAADWVNNIPAQYLATIRGAVTFHPCGGAPEETSLGSFGYPDANGCIGTHQTYMLMQDLSALAANFLSLPWVDFDLTQQFFTDLGNYDLLTNEAITPGLTSSLVPLLCAGQNGPNCQLYGHIPESYIQAFGTLYKFFAWGNDDCLRIAYSPDFIDDVGNINIASAQPYGEPNEAGLYNAILIPCYTNAGVLTKPILVFVDCIGVSFCDPCPLGNDQAGLSQAGSDPTQGPLAPPVSPCATLGVQLQVAIQAFNSSLYSTNYNVDLSTLPDALQLWATAGICPCFSDYLNYLQPYITWEPTIGPPPSDVVGIDQWSGCVDCPEAYHDYLEAVNAFKDWAFTLDPQFAQGIQIAPSAVFSNELVCHCVPGYIAAIQHAMLDSVLSSAELEDATLVRIYSVSNGQVVPNCTPPVPCEPVFPPNTPDFDPPAGNPCDSLLYLNAVVNGQQAYAEQVLNWQNALANAYTTQCLSALETFKMQFQDPEHHFTLYYYDQAGNLVRTVPPEGVDPLPIGEVINGAVTGQATIAAIATDRATGSRTVFTGHRLPSDHLYNSLNNPTRLAMPDHDRMNIWESALPAGLPHDLRVTGSVFHGNRGYLSGWRDGPNSRTRGYVFSTDDGGRSWSRSFGLLGTRLNALEFTPGGTGFMVGVRGTVLTSVDGGGSWDLITDLTPWNVDFADLHVRDNSTVVLGGRRFTSNNIEVFRSIDGGVNWTRTTGHNIDLGGIVGLRGFLDGGTYRYISAGNLTNGENGVIGAAVGAAVFTEANSTAPGRNRAELRAVCSAGGNAMYASGDHGSFMYCLDPGSSGDHWLRRPSGTKDHFRRMAFLNGDVGVALFEPLSGGAWRLRHTTNGGRTWTDVGDPTWAFNDLRSYSTTATTASLLAVGNNGLVVRVIVNTGGFIGFQPLLGPLPNTNITAVWARTDGTNTRAFFGTANGAIYTAPDLMATDLVWADLAQPVAFFTSIAIRDIVAQVLSPTSIHAMVRSNDNRLASRVVDLTAAPAWGTQATTATPAQYTALTLRSDGLAVSYRSDGANSRYLRFFALNGTPSVTPVTVSVAYPDLPNEVIRALAVAPSNNNSITLVGANTTNTISSLHRALLSYNGNQVTSLVNANKSSRVRPLPLRGMAKQGWHAVGDEGTLFSAATHTHWIAERTPVTATLHGVALLNAGGEVVAVGDGGTAFRMMPGNPASFVPFTLPQALDLRDVVVVGNSITIAAANGTLFHCPDYTTPVFVQLGSYYPGTFQGLAARNGEVFAVGDAGKVMRVLGSMAIAVNEVFTPRLNDVHFADANNGYAVGANMVARRTVDGGLTWQPVHIAPILTSGTVSAGLPTRSFTAVHSHAPGAALAVGTSNLSATFTGTVWSGGGLPTTPLIHFRDVVATPSDAQVVVGNATAAPLGRIFRRNSPSAAWSSGITTANGQYALHAWPSYLDPVTGTLGEDVLTGGDNGSVHLLRFSNNIWSGPLPNVAFVPNAPNIRALWFHDRTMGLAAGSGGAIYRSDGTAPDHSTIGWVPTTDAISAVEPELLGQSTQSSATISTIGFADRHQGFIGGTYAGAPPGFARTVRDEMGLYSQRFWYDQLGRLILSQNTKQFNAEPKRFSYTLYDELGRVREAGELHEPAGAPFAGILGMNVNGLFKPEVIDYNTFQAWVDPNDERYEVVRTHYDEEFIDPNIFAQFTNGQQHLRLRVAHTTYAEKIPDDRDVLTYDHATHYSYDIHGNVNELVQEHVQMGVDAGDFMARFKRLTYSYDLISGNVKQVAYQDGAPDQFHHRYTYDADNRLVQAETSRNDDFQNLWRTDAQYYYYPHGPLERMEIGDAQVQGLDYAYTLQGWLKGINSDLLLPDKDIGQDALASGPHPLVGRDAYGLSLGYFGKHDYRAIDNSRWDGGTATRPFAPLGGQMSTDLIKLYNGNIAHTVNSLVPFTTSSAGYTGATGELGQPLAMVYRYDQLNRLVLARGYAGLQDDNTWTSVTDPVTDRYLSKYSYDANGNIEGVARLDQDGQQYDAFTYKYHKTASGHKLRNRLYHLFDAADPGNNLVNEPGGAVDIAYLADDPLDPYDETDPLINDPAGNSNYLYDEIGNLVTDRVNDIEEITWTVAGKVKAVNRPTGSPAQWLAFGYGAAGYRIWKDLLDANEVLTGRTHYVHDAQGNLMATYRYHASSNELLLEGRVIYGSSRLGIDGAKAAPLNDPEYNPSGVIQYELTDHLGNVTVTVTDELVAVDEGQDMDPANDYNGPVIVSAQGYEPFGSLLPERSYRVELYRFGFQGQEVENDLLGRLLNLEFKYRVYDPRIGRFLSIDPIGYKYPWNSVYAFGENDVIRCIDLEGLEKLVKTHHVVLHDGTTTFLVLNGGSTKKVRNAVVEVTDGNPWGQNSTYGETRYADVYHVQVSPPTPENPAGEWRYYDSDGTTGGQAELAMLRDRVKWKRPDIEVSLSEEWKYFRHSYEGRRFVQGMKKTSAFAGVILTGGTFGTLSLGGRGLALIDLGFGFDELTADDKGSTFVTQRLSPEGKAAFSSFKAAFGLFMRQRQLMDLSAQPSALEFVDFLNANYQFIDGVMEATDDLKDVFNGK